jgi:type I restriction enzyme S subunit
MTSRYSPIGDLIRLVDERNLGLKVNHLLGLSISKEFIPSVANTIGTDMENYKIIRKNQFACSLMQVRRDKKLPVALLDDFDVAIISQAYPVFEVLDTTVILPEYLMLWFSRPEFDREACFHAVGGVRGSLEWEDFCSLRLPVPSLEKQLKVIREYKVVSDRIKLNTTLISNLEDVLKTVYKQWFVDFEFSSENTTFPSKATSVNMEWNDLIESEIPCGWKVKNLQSICEKIGSGSTPKGGKASYHEYGISLIRSTNVYDFVFSSNDLAFIDEKQAKALQNVSVQKNDVLLNITGVSVARCCIVPDYALPARVNQHVMIIRPKEDLYLAFYLLCVLCYSDNKARLLGISQAGSTREALTKEEVEAFNIVIPSASVLKKFHTFAGKIVKMIEVRSLSNSKFIDLRNLLLSKLATIN